MLDDVVCRAVSGFQQVEQGFGAVEPVEDTVMQIEQQINKVNKWG